MLSQVADDHDNKSTLEMVLNLFAQSIVVV